MRKTLSSCCQATHQVTICACPPKYKEYEMSLRDPLSVTVCHTYSIKYHAEYLASQTLLLQPLSGIPMGQCQRRPCVREADAVYSLKIKLRVEVHDHAPNAAVRPAKLANLDRYPLG